ncbi:hypothetical protein M9Y10_019626 [Tritrichomonas musculus]|uniref:DUF3447 domain-containing protein n=1 Tax=Tritrichomonas musculus TaxID=1915356 RepID=A0ABR2HHR6_9EUKA
MNFQGGIEEMKVFYELLLDFLDKDQQLEEIFDSLSKLIKNHDFILNNQELKLFLKLIKKVFHYHFHSAFFYDKVFRVISIFINDIKQIYSNLTIFNMFKFDKRILLFLIENQILTIDSKILKILEQDEYRQKYYLEYLDIRNINSNDSTFIEKRNRGENDNYICELIRNDSIIKFVQYINKNLISIDKYQIPPSIFETNSYLLKNKLNLIEYASFFGSFKIFNYLICHGAPITPDLWNYAIHSRKISFIHLLEEKYVQNPEAILDESVKCHHNELSLYFYENDHEKLDLFALKYYNYHFLSTEIEYSFNLFIAAVQKEHLVFVERFLTNEKVDVNRQATVKYTNKEKICYKRITYYDRADDWVAWSTIPRSTRMNNRVNLINRSRQEFNFENASALHIAIEKENIDIVKLLLKKPEIDVNQQCIRYHYNYKVKETLTPLHIAIEKENCEIVELLLQNPNIDVNKRSVLITANFFVMKTPINQAINLGNAKLVDVLSRHPKININAKSIFEMYSDETIYEYEENAPLNNAAEINNYQMCQSILSCQDINVNCEQIELYRPNDSKMLFKKKETSLHMAIIANNSGICNLLLAEKNIDVNSLFIKEFINEDKERKKQLITPLFLAIENTPISFIRSLFSILYLDMYDGLIDIGGGTNLLEGNVQLSPYSPRPVRCVMNSKNINFNQKKWNDNSYSYYRIDMIYNVYANDVDNDEELLEEEEDVIDDYNFEYFIFRSINPREAFNAEYHFPLENLMQPINEQGRIYDQNDMYYDFY